MVRMGGVQMAEDIERAGVQLREVGAAYVHGLVGGRHVVAVASRCVADGQDGPGMVGLASLYADARRTEIETALDAALDEIGQLPKDPDEIAVNALRAVARLFLIGALDIHSLARIADVHVGYSGPAFALPLVKLDYDLDRMEYDRSVVCRDVEARARQMAQEFLRASELGAATSSQQHLAQPQFFAGDDLTLTPFGEVFVARLRKCAEKWDTDVRPVDTWHEETADPVLVGVAVPGLSGPRTVLWVKCWKDIDGSPVLEGSWGDRGPVTDWYGHDPVRELTVRGSSAHPGTLAELAAGWIVHQLRRTIVRDEYGRRGWSHRDEDGPLERRRLRRRIRRSVVERTDGRATGLQLPSVGRRSEGRTRRGVS